MMLHNPYSSHYFQVDHPHTPYHGDIPNGMVPGKTVMVKGQMTGNDFEVNFQTHNGIAFHLNPRAHMHKVVRNANLHGAWGPEEDDGPMPFHPHHPFEIIIKCEHDRFLVAVNGQHCFEFCHRQAFQDISHIEVKGTCHLHNLVFSGGHQHTNDHSYVPHVPFAVPVHGAHGGKMFQIRGDVLPHTGRFVINLQNGEGDSHDIALHMSVRFDDPYNGEAVIVANRQHGAWGPEIRDHSGPFPFQRGVPFEVLVLCEEHEWKIAVNGRHFASMHHRNSFHDADHLAVEGDVAISSIKEY